MGQRGRSTEGDGCHPWRKEGRVEQQELRGGGEGRERERGDIITINRYSW